MTNWVATPMNRAKQVRSTGSGRLDTQEEDLLLRYFMYGGGVAALTVVHGLVVGLIGPHN